MPGSHSKILSQEFQTSHMTTKSNKILPLDKGVDMDMEVNYLFCLSLEKVVTHFALDCIQVSQHFEIYVFFLHMTERYKGY